MKMNYSFPIQYFHHEKLIEKLNYLRNKMKKCGFCDKNFSQFCEPVKALETEMWKKVFFSTHSNVAEWKLSFRDKRRI